MENVDGDDRWRIGDRDFRAMGGSVIRKDFADSIDANAVHGSDGADTARNEIAYFFASCEVFSR